jgi:hypothetical protein
MPLSQFDSPATLLEDGTVRVSGPVTVTEPAQDVEFRFMIVQNGTVIEGKGMAPGGGGHWSGTAASDQGQLDAGPALAIGLAFRPMKGPGRGVGYRTFTWSEQIELKR